MPPENYRKPDLIIDQINGFYPWSKTLFMEYESESHKVDLLNNMRRNQPNVYDAIKNPVAKFKVYLKK